MSYYRYSKYINKEIEITKSYLDYIGSGPRHSRRQLLCLLTKSGHKLTTFYFEPNKSYVGTHKLKICFDELNGWVVDLKDSQLNIKNADCSYLATA